MPLPVHLDRLKAQYLEDTDPRKDYTKDTLAVVQARTKRIRDNYTAFFQSLISSGIPTGGLAGQVLTKSSDTDLDVAWSTIVSTKNDRNIDGGSADSVYLLSQKIDGGCMDCNLIQGGIL